MKISMIKKIKEDGSPCRKCAEVEQRLKAAGLFSRIDQVIIADERDPDSAGMRLAAQFEVERAPFFLVEKEGESPRVYTVYLKFLKEVLGSTALEQDEAKDIMEKNPDLDFL
ncbi:MAG: hypothetical protein ACRESK_09930 [Gammaproteobacteria bacterium]